MAQGGLKIQNILQCGIALNFSRMKSVLFPKFSDILVFLSEKSGRTNFRSKLFWIFQILTGKFLGFSTFAPTFFSVFQISTGKFSGFRNFAAKKKSLVFRSRCRVRIAGFTTKKSVSYVTNTFFFQLSRRIFLGFSNFEPKNFGRKNFRGKKIRPYQISNQKFLAGKNFRPCGQEAICRKNF